jgi:hypothetical protein
MLKTTVASPWGSRQPDPHFDRAVEIYELALTPGLRSPFLPADELHPDTPSKPEDVDKSAGNKTTPSATKPASDKKPIPVNIDFADLSSRLSKVPAPAPAGNYDALQLTDKRLCWLDATDDIDAKRTLRCLDIANHDDGPATVMSDVKSFEISLSRKKMLIRKDKNFYNVDSDVKASEINDSKNLEKDEMDLSHWTFSTNPREEFHGIYLDAWRLERDYFYDPIRIVSIGTRCVSAIYRSSIASLTAKSSMTSSSRWSASSPPCTPSFMAAIAANPPTTSTSLPSVPNCAAMRRPEAISSSTSICTIPTCPVKHRRWLALSLWSTTAK